MVVISKARRMQSQLRLLRHERGLILDPAPNLPLLEPLTTEVDKYHPMIVSGIASKASTRDFDGVITVPYAFGELPASVPLRLDHDEATDVGSIEELRYSADGSLCITARVTCAKAVRMPAFSIAAAIDQFDIDMSTATATIRRARLQEISLVTCPCDPHALVLSRAPPLAASEFYTLMADKVRVLIKITELIKAARSDHAHA